MRWRTFLAATACAGTVWLVAARTAAATNGCRDDIVASDGYRIRNVGIGARYAQIAVPPAGTAYSPALRTELTEKLHEALRQEELQEQVDGATEFQLLNGISTEKGGAVGVRYVDSCVRVVPEEECVRALGSGNAKCVDLAMRSYSIRIDASNPWSSLLETSRSNEATFFRNVPAPLLALNPKITTAYDRRYGFAAGVGVRSNLLDLGKNLSRQPLEVRATRLDLSAKGSKSLQNAFYTGDLALSLEHETAGAIHSYSLDAAADVQHIALGNSEVVETAARLGGSIQFHLLGPFSTSRFGGNYVKSSNRVAANAGLPGGGSGENGFAFRWISSGNLAGGYSRTAIWADGGAADMVRGTYRRFATMTGYAREFPVADHQAISLELLLGGGRSWGNVPVYSQFFGGNQLTNFLYEAADSAKLQTMPGGPLLRSAGTNQAGLLGQAAQGGTSYWHANLNLAFPIPKLSRPLIPDVKIEGLVKKDANCKVVFDADGNLIFEDQSLGHILKSQGACSKNTLSKIYQRQGLTPEEAKARAEADLRDINSILGHLSDNANLVSVKPLVLFDAARLYGTAPAGAGTRYGIGGGLQLIVVVARLEAGYVYGVRRFPGDPAGNFVVRLTFQNLF